MRIPELLAPVGSMEHLKVAINAGASSVYLSGKNYGARKFAENFSIDEITEAVNLSHMHNVKVYVTVNTLIRQSELENVIKYFNLKKFSIFGHSWGGMLALEWVCKHPHDGLDKLVLFSTLPSTKIWNDEHLKMIESYPKEEIEAILNERDKKPFDKVLFKKGMKRFYDDHVGKKSQRKYQPKTKHFPKTNKEIYNKMWGFNELFGNGTLADYDVTNLLHKVDVPTLIISGKFDESTPEMNRVMNEKIPHSRWVLLENSHHAGYNEEPERVLDEISKFIK